MDSKTFDAMTRSLTASQPRRDVLRVLGAAGIAGVLAGASGAEILARGKRRKKKKKCRGGKVPCRGGCLEPGLICCPFASDGIGGACPPSDPHCCSLHQLGGCCPPEFPVCCPYDCCEAGQVCDEWGECSSG
jgi:hypothetical protein